ncbi:cell envelope integrity protein TolA [Roseateles sp. P5_E4]
MLDAVGSSSFVGRDDAAQAEEARRRAEEAARRAAEEARRRAEEARRRAEEAKRQAEAARKAAEEAQAKAEQTRAQQDQEKAAKLKDEHKAKQADALKAEAQAVFKEKEHGLAKARLKDAQDNRAPAAPSAATQEAQKQVDKARATYAFYDPLAAAPLFNSGSPFINGLGPLRATPPLGGNNPLSPGLEPLQSKPPLGSNPPPFLQPMQGVPVAKHDVDGYAQQIRDVYAQSGAATAAQQLAQAMGDTSLSPEQRKQLMAKAQPVVSKLAETAGQEARHTDLQADGQAGKTTGIDDKAEYHALVDDLATAADAAGDPAQARQLARTLLDHLAAPAKPGGGADGLDLFGDALRAHNVGKGALHDAVLFALQSPQNAPAGSVLAAPPDALASTVRLIAGVPEPAGVAGASPTDLAAMKTYTDDEIDLSHELLLDARKKEAELAKYKPGSEDYEKAAQAYRSAANLTIRERAKSEQAIAAELRQTYKADAKNAVATEDAAHEIAKRFRDDPEAQMVVDAALKTVKTENAQQRDTGNKLYEFHRATDQVTTLQAQLNATGHTDEGAYKTALADYETKRNAVMETLGHEISLATAGEPDGAARDKAIDDAAMGLVDRYLGDEDLTRMAAAARIISHTESASGTTNQMLALGKAMPADTSLQIRELVMSDPGVKKLVDSYVNESAQAVTDAYDKGVKDYKDEYGDTYRRDKNYAAPATAATRKLMELTDPAKHPELTPEITARIVNKLFGPDGNGTLDKVIDDVSLHGDHSAELMTIDGTPEDFKSFRGMDNDMLMGYGLKDFDEIIGGVSTVIDRAAAGSHPTGNSADGKPVMAWESDEVQKAVESAGQSFTMNIVENWGPQQGRLNGGFQRAIANGSGATLALETARQEKDFQFKMDWGPAGGHEVDLAKETLQSTAKGLDDLKKNSRQLFEDKHKDMAALEVPQLRFGKLMTEEQQQKALQAVIKQHPDFAKAFEDGKRTLDARGYQLLRDTEMVTFYGQDDRLGKQDGYSQVDDKRKALLDDDYTKTMLMGSDAASTRIKEQAVHSSLNWMRDAGITPPAAAGVVPVNLYLQWTGDFAENAIENNKLKGVYGAGYGRLGNHGPAAAASWGAVGVTQLWFTDYLYHNLKFDSSESWRKPVLLGLVGGFAGIKVLEAGAALAHKGAQALPPSMQRVLNDTRGLPSLSTIERGSEFTRTAEWKSIGFFGLLHADAAVWDASRVNSEINNFVDGKPVDQRNFWTATVNLSNDVAISTLEFKGAWNLLKDPLVTTEEAKRIAAQGGAAVTRDGPIKAAQLAIEGAVNKYALGRFGLKAVMTPANIYEAVGKFMAKKLPFMEAGPAGWLATMAWTATDLVNWYGNEQKIHKQLESVDRDFLSAAGMSPGAADNLADRDLLKANFNRWLSGESLAEGLLDAYSDAKGDPDKFVDWVNELQRTGRLEQVRQASEYDTDKQAPEHYEAFLALPEDPTKVDLSYSSVAYNGSKKRFEDPMTQTYYRGGSWVYDKDIAAAPGAAKVNDPNKAHYFIDYNPKSREIHCMADVNIRLSARGGEGLKNWLQAHGMAPPPLPKPDDTPPAPVDTSKTARGNTYTVKADESVWSIAGNDPKVVEWIYGHNLWLNDRMESDKRPINARGGQNPNYIEVGDVLVLPDGYHAPKA